MHFETGSNIQCNFPFFQSLNFLQLTYLINNALKEQKQVSLVHREPCVPSKSCSQNNNELYIELIFMHFTPSKPVLTILGEGGANLEPSWFLRHMCMLAHLCCDSSVLLVIQRDHPKAWYLFLYCCTVLTKVMVESLQTPLSSLQPRLHQLWAW